VPTGLIFLGEDYFTFIYVSNIGFVGIIHENSVSLKSLWIFYYIYFVNVLDLHIINSISVIIMKSTDRFGQEKSNNSNFQGSSTIFTWSWIYSLTSGDNIFPSSTDLFMLLSWNQLIGLDSNNAIFQGLYTIFIWSWICRWTRGDNTNSDI